MIARNSLHIGGTCDGVWTLVGSVLGWRQPGCCVDGNVEAATKKNLAAVYFSQTVTLVLTDLDLTVALDDLVKDSVVDRFQPR